MDAILKQDDADESLQRYKAQLLGAAAKGDRGDASDPQKPVWKSTTRSRGQRRVDGVGRQKCYFHTGGN